MYVIQFKNGRRVIISATNKMEACGVFIELAQENEPVAKLLKYTGNCDYPEIKVIFSID